MSAVVPFMISEIERCNLPFGTPCTLYIVPQDNQTSTSLVLDEIIETVDPESYVCRGTFDGRRVIAKFAYDNNYLAKHLKSEADNYETLKALQGTCIPRFYMYFEGSVSTNYGERPKDLSCIIIEDCGSNLPDLDEMGKNERCFLFCFVILGFYERPC